MAYPEFIILAAGTLVLMAILCAVVLIFFLRMYKTKRAQGGATNAKGGLTGTCTHPGCSATNPPAARFCRMCGQELS
jgi:hypothetical protein